MAQTSWDSLINQAGDTSFDVIPAGDYEAVVESAEHRVAQSGKHMIVAAFRIQSGPYAKRMVWNNFVLTTDNENALGFFFRHMDALGVPADVIRTMPSPEEGGMAMIASKIVGAPARIKVGTRVWNNEERNEVKSVKKSAAAPAAPGPAPAAPAPAPAAPAPAPAPPQQIQPPGPAPAAAPQSPDVPF